MREFQIFVYDENINFVCEMSRDIKNTIRFSEDANGGQRDMYIDLAINWQDLNTDDIKIFRFIRVYEISNYAPNGRLVYSGWVSRIEYYMRDSSQGVKISVLGLVSLLKRVYFKDSDLSVGYTGEDPSNIVADIIQSFQLDYPSTGDDWIGTDTIADIRVGNQVVVTGKSIDYTFDNTKCFDAIKKCLSLSGNLNYYWKIDAGGDVIFKPKPTSATHIFTVEKDIQSLFAPKIGEDIINRVHVDYDGGSTSGEDSNTYGRSEIHIQEQTNLDGANEIIDRILTDQKDVKTASTITINNQYDIFSIKAGDACRITNIPINDAIFPDNMFIKSVEYTANYATLTIDVQELDINSILRQN